MVNTKGIRVAYLLQSGFGVDETIVTQNELNAFEVNELKDIILCPGFHVIIWRAPGVTILQSFNVEEDTKHVFISQGGVIQHK
jgi:hypothetical protein